MLTQVYYNHISGYLTEFQLSNVITFLLNEGLVANNWLNFCPHMQTQKPEILIHTALGKCV